MTPYIHFNPRQYLDTYYATIQPENRAMLDFLVNAFKMVSPDALSLDFGCGPMLYSAIAGAHRVREMHLAEYLPLNRVELSHWLSAKPNAFDWREAIRTVLELEGRPSDDLTMKSHEAVIRANVSRVMPCDLTAAYPLEDTTLSGAYDVLVTSLCVEAVAPDLPTWIMYMGKLGSLLRPGGKLFLISVKKSHAYNVGKHTYPVLSLDEDNIAHGLRAAGFAQDAALRHAHANDPFHPYEGLIFATARKL